MSHALSEQEIADIREAFSVFDKNNDGQITIDDLRTVLGSMGRTPTEDQLLSILNGPKNTGGAVEFQNFLKMMFRLSVYLTFCLFDKDGDGFVTKDEIKQVMSHLGEKITDEEANAMLKEADTNHDGKIQYEEFAQMMRSKE